MSIPGEAAHGTCAIRDARRRDLDQPTGIILPLTGNWPSPATPRGKLTGSFPPPSDEANAEGDVSPIATFQLWLYS